MNIHAVKTDRSDPSELRFCKSCKNTMPLSMFNIMCGYYRRECKSCQSEKAKLYFKKHELLLSKQFWKNKCNSAKRRSKLYSCDFSITPEDLESIYMIQKGKCWYTGDPMKTISIERIYNKKGYTTDNIVLCEYKINKLRNYFTLEEFIDMCNKISKLH